MVYFARQKSSLNSDHILRGDKGVFIHIADQFFKLMDLASADAAGDDRYHAVFSPARDLGYCIIILPEHFQNGCSPFGADDTDFCKSDCQFILKPHANHIACGKSRRINDHIDEIVNISQDISEGQNPDGRVDETAASRPRICSCAWSGSPAGYRGWLTLHGPGKSGVRSEDFVG